MASSNHLKYTQDLDMDDIIKLLKKDANYLESSYNKQYELLLSNKDQLSLNQDEGPKSRPNKRFLRNLLTDTKGHNVRLLEKERLSAEKKMQEIESRSESFNRNDNEERKGNAMERQQDKIGSAGGSRKTRYTSPRKDSISPKRRHSTKSDDKHDERSRSPRRKTSKVSSRERSPSETEHRSRSSKVRSDRDYRERSGEAADKTARSSHRHRQDRTEKDEVIDHHRSSRRHRSEIHLESDEKHRIRRSRPKSPDQHEGKERPSNDSHERRRKSRRREGEPEKSKSSRHRYDKEGDDSRTARHRHKSDNDGYRHKHHAERHRHRSHRDRSKESSYRDERRHTSPPNKADHHLLESNTPAIIIKGRGTTNQADVNKRFSSDYDPSTDISKPILGPLYPPETQLSALGRRMMKSTAGSTNDIRHDETRLEKPSDDEVIWPEYSKGPREWDIGK